MTYAGGIRNRRKLDKKGGLIKEQPMQKPTQLAITSGVFQEVVPPKGTTKLLKKWRGPFQITEVHQGGRFYRPEHWKSGSLRENQTAHCLVRGLVHPSGHARGRLFNCGSCL